MRFLLTAPVSFWLLIIFATFHSPSTTAQITLDSADYSLIIPTTDTLRVTAYNATFPTFPMAPNSTWDLSFLIDSPIIIPIHRIPYVGHDFADSTNLAFLGYSLPHKQGINITHDAITIATSQLHDTSIDLSLRTINFGDSIHIPDQVYAYPSTKLLLKLPATYLTAFQDTSDLIIQFDLTIGFYAYVDEPCYIKHTTITENQVTGWGNMRVKELSTLPSPYLAVLQIASTKVTTDSFFLNGIPMPGSLLTLLGIYQGKTDTQFLHYYYRIGELTPLAEVYFNDAAYTQPYKAYTHTQRLVRVGVANIATAAIQSVYPNPITGNHLYLSTADATPVSATITGIAGNVVQQRILIPQNKTAALSLPEHMAPGPYLLTLVSAGKTTTTIIIKQ